MKPESTSTILHLAGKMKRPTIPTGSRAQRRMRSLKRPVLFGAIFVLIVTAAFYTATSASSSRNFSRGSLPSSASKTQRSNKTRAGSDNKTGLLSKRLINSRELFALLAPQASPFETIDTFAANCTTPQDVFNLGDTVCAKVTNAPLRAAAPLRRINWSDPNGNVGQTLDVTSDPQTNLFVIPASGTTVVDGVTIDNRGTWAASINSTSDSSTRAIAYFTVRDPQNAAADLAVYNFSTDAADPVEPGANTGSFIWLTNNGPDVAQNVHVTQATPSSLTYVSVTQDSGPALTCTHSATGTDCTISSLAVGAVATLTINYSASGSSGVVTTRAAISSDTNDPRPDSNTSDAQVEIRAAGAPPATCSLGCQPDMTVTANTTQGGQSGAIVNYSGNVEVSGDCGTTTTTPASGTFFPVGATQVTVTSSQGGGSCSFTVTVIDTAPPTIDCPANLGVTAPDGDCQATVDPGTPTATGNGVTVSGVRSDGQALDAAYPAGTTTITWTATDSDGRRATCTQTITVTVNDTTPPTITAPPDVNISTPPGTSGSCGLVVGETELGTPNANDNCTVNVTRTGVPAGSFFPVGTTIVTYTARDGAGNTATATQNVTVTDATPPLIAAPPDASYTCPSEVPAADASQATRGVVLDSNGDPLPPGPPSDNCGTPTVTVSESRTGAGSASNPLIITRTFTATDAHGNSASATQTITVIDNVAPSLSLNGASSVTVECHTGFTDPGATASDNCASSVPVTVSGAVNADAPGTYTLTYSASDAAGNAAPSVTRTVTVVDTIPPTLTLNGAASMTVECHTGFSDPGATASDSCAGDLTGSIAETGSVNPDAVGTYTLTYSVNDGNGHTTTATRTVNVVDTTPPTITLNGANPMTVECHTAFSDPGATANDGCAGTVAVTASGSVNANVPGTYTITYSAHDPSNNSATSTRTVNVVDTTPPTITLKNVTIRLWPPNHKYQTVNVTDLVQSASDSCDGDVDVNDVVISKVTSDEVENGNGDGNTMNDIVIAGNCKSVQLRSEREGDGNGRVYTITFKVTDANGKVGTATAKVYVPHNSGENAVDSGVHYTVNSSCQ
jgi:hypothetical protein